MKVSTKGRYALIFMLDLAVSNKSGCTSIKDIATRNQLPMKYLEQIASLLVNAGMIQSIRGANGGYKLSKNPTQCDIYEILKVAEGDFICMADIQGDISQSGRNIAATITDFWDNMNQCIETYLKSITLQELVENCNQNGYIEYYI